MLARKVGHESRCLRTRSFRGDAKSIAQNLSHKFAEAQQEESEDISQRRSCAAEDG
jgi:hypothetical protein